MVKTFNLAKKRTQGEVRVAHGGVLPSLELNDSKRATPIDSIEITINFVKTRKLWESTQINLDDAFCFYISQYLHDDCDLINVAKIHD